MDISHFVILECRHLANGCVLKCGCICLMLFRNLSCLDTIICYINTIGIVPAYACNVCALWLRVMQPLANVHEPKWTPHVKRESDVAISHFVILECRHLANGCVLKCGCICLMLFRNLSCLDTIICYINTIGIVPAYACNVCALWLRVMQPLANVHEPKWTPHVKRESDVAQSYTSSAFIAKTPLQSIVRLETHLVVMCTTSQCKLRSLFRNLSVRDVICIMT